MSLKAKNNVSTCMFCCSESSMARGWGSSLGRLTAQATQDCCKGDTRSAI